MFKTYFIFEVDFIAYKLNYQNQNVPFFVMTNLRQMRFIHKHIFIGLKDPQ